LTDEQDLASRITKIKDLSEDCFKFLESSSKDLLTHQIIYGIAKLTRQKMAPVKLAEIAESISRENDKNKQDIIRLRIEKSLSKCGIVEKLRYAPNDVRFLLTAYRFQKIRKIDSFRDDRIEKIGDVFELPKSTWPIPDEYFILGAKKFALEETLKKINSDYDTGIIPRGKYEELLRQYNSNLENTIKQINSKFNDISKLI